MNCNLEQDMNVCAKFHSNPASGGLKHFIETTNVNLMVALEEL